MICDAVLSPCGTYRYRLDRDWTLLGTRNGPRACFVMLNPSTADAIIDDPTIRRCIGFARSWGIERLTVVNLFALRSTDPAALRTHHDPVGPENDLHLLEATRGAQIVVAAWGANGGLQRRDQRVTEMLTAAGRAVHRLGPPTLHGRHPRHPLYLAGTTQLEVHP